MRILLDHNLPRQLAKALPDSEVATVRSQGWNDLENGDLLKAAEKRGFEVFLTGDKNLSYQQNLKGRRLAVIVVPVMNRPQLEPYYPQIRQAVQSIQPGGYMEMAKTDPTTDGKPITARLLTQREIPSKDPALYTERMQAPEQLPEEVLAKLGYPGYAYLCPEGGGTAEEAQNLLVNMLTAPNYAARVALALPWVAYHWALEVNWDKVIKEVYAAGYANRLGFVVEMACQAAEQEGFSEKSHRLEGLLPALECLKDDTERTLCMDDQLTMVKRLRRQAHASTQAEKWKVWSDVTLPSMVHLHD